MRIAIESTFYNCSTSPASTFITGNFGGLISSPRGEFETIIDIEPICRVLETAPSWYHEQEARAADPTRVSRRARRDAVLRPEIDRECRANRRMYGAKKVWKVLRREGYAVARCTVARVMQSMRVRGRRVRTTIPPNA